MDIDKEDTCFFAEKVPEVGIQLYVLSVDSILYSDLGFL
jgi:hypothetical protein